MRHRFIKKVFSLNKDILGVVHFAAHKSVSESVENPLEYYSNNINSLINLINVCNENKVNNFIFLLLARYTEILMSCLFLKKLH